jgi:hypothetical protein
MVILEVNPLDPVIVVNEETEDSIEGVTVEVKFWDKEVFTAHLVKSYEPFEPEDMILPSYDKYLFVRLFDKDGYTMDIEPIEAAVLLQMILTDYNARMLLLYID